MRNKARWLFGAVLISLVCGFWAWVSLKNRREDFIYLYSGTRLYASGQNPYRRLVFQNELRNILGRPNPYPSRFFASANPPADFIVLEPLIYLSYREGFYCWSAIILFSLIAICFSAISFAGFSLREPRAWLLGLVAASWPGIFHGVFYHRMSVPVLAAFLLGLLFWEKGRKDWAAFFWGFLILLPQWFFCVGLFLLLNGEFRALTFSSWLCAAQLFPYLFGAHPWGEWETWVLSLKRYGNRFVFFDDQSFPIAFYKILFFRSFLAALKFHASLFVPTWNLRILRWVGELLSGIFVFFISIRKGSFPGRLSLVLSVALLGSLYSHCGDEAWILPIFLCALREDQSLDRAFWILFLFLSINIILIPNYHALSSDFWFWAGFWSVGYALLIAIYWACVPFERSESVPDRL